MDIAKQNRVSDEVFHALLDTFSLCSEDIETLISLSSMNQSNKARLCVHPTVECPVHQMFIAHKKGAYIRPHKHVDKNESMLILQGRADYVVFNEIGKIDRVVPMSIAPDTFHSIVIRSEWLLFFEVVEGPFERSKTTFPDWSPTVTDRNAVADYMNALDAAIQEFN